MSSFNERDVRRHYDLLQHKPELGFTQVKVMDGADVIGLGLFDNEEDFVSECERYNGLGTILAGVSPRSVRLLDDYGGLQNRIRTLFMDVVEESHIDHITGVSVPDPSRLSDEALEFLGDTTVLNDGEHFYPLDEPIPLEGDALAKVSDYFLGPGSPGISVGEFCKVIGSSRIPSTWLRRRIRFRRYRPYILEGISVSITGTER